jgi:hypothetical protein
MKVVRAGVMLQVQQLLQSLPQKEKWIFTNCNEKHANIALELLNLKVRLITPQMSTALPPSLALSVWKPVLTTRRHAEKNACVEEMGLKKDIIKTAL